MPETSASQCNVCGEAGAERIFHSRSGQSLTSLCQLRPVPVEVRFCGTCGHLAGNALEDIAEFYESDYKILINSEEDDQIYEVRGDEIVYRTDHQLRVLLDKISPDPQMKVLDYGCAKGEMSRRLAARIPGLHVHLFDVSRMYQPFWEKFTEPMDRAIHETPAEWQGRFDLITSYFAFEHIPDPARAAAHVHSLLRDGGLFYAIVPDTFGNIADFIVVDHVNHFTTASLERLLGDAGFDRIKIDDGAHRGAFVVTARRGVRRGDALTRAPGEITELRRRAMDLAAYWNHAGERVEQAETASAGAASAIYGAGFYGAFIYAHLKDVSPIACFVDRNPHQEGQKLFGLPIVAPENLPGTVETLYVGLNPAIARSSMAGAAVLADGRVTARYLD